MRLAILTPLFPPDTAGLAVYTKEMAGRLAQAGCDIHVVLYGEIPESVPNVTMLTVSKHNLVFVRIFKYLRTLLALSKDIDVLYVQNGSSVELPVLMYSFLKHTPIVLRIGDGVALERTQSKPLLRYIFKKLTERVHDCMVSGEIVYPIPNAIKLSTPDGKPEILPFEEHPTQALQKWEDQWNEHVLKLQDIFKHATK